MGRFFSLSPSFSFFISLSLLLSLYPFLSSSLSIFLLSLFLGLIIFYIFSRILEVLVDFIRRLGRRLHAQRDWHMGTTIYGIEDAESQWQGIFATAIMEEDVTVGRATTSTSEEGSSCSYEPANQGMQDGYIEDWIYKVDNPDSSRMIRDSSILR